jgi:CBASS immunity sensor of nucleotide second messenger signals
VANQVAAIISGIDYQHLYSWYHVLELMMPRKQVARVRVEDEDAVSADDVTVRHEAESEAADHFYQIKYHMNQDGHYSTDYLIAHKPNETSLLKKLYKTWETIRAEQPSRPFEIYLVSNWAWDSVDKFKGCIRGKNNALLPEFFNATARMDIGKLRKKWETELDVASVDFEAFMRSLRFRVGFDCWDEMMQRVAERMDNLRLKSDDTSLLVASGIVREWVKSGPQDLTRDVLEEAIQKHRLFLPPEKEPSVHVYLMTIKDQKYDIEPDYVLDWRDHFVGSEQKRGHELKAPAAWNGVLLPELEKLEATINKDTDCRLIRARGQARLSPWFALGYVFCEVNRYTIEVDQFGKHWRTDAAASPDFALTSNAPDGETVDGDGTTVAVGISVAGDLAEDVRKDIEGRTERVASLLLIRPERELGRDCLRGAGDAVALAAGVKKLSQAFVKRWKATKLLLYYYGPLGGAAFMGHQFNAVCREIQIMENQHPGYSPSFLLR